nr:MAG: replication associated protein [Cressdnaviricota sp.]
MPPKHPRHRNWCFTVNNPTDTDNLVLLSIECKYIIFGEETAPQTGTQHLQGYVVFESAVTFASAKSRLPQGCHLEAANGNSEQNIAYCSKEGKITERGARPVCIDTGGMEKDRWIAVRDAAKAGRFDEITADVFIRYYGNLCRIRDDHLPLVPHLSSVCGLWIHGESGCGKTSSVIKSFPPAALFIKPRNKWWDGYNLEQFVLLDDVDIYDIALGGCLKHWADRYAFIAERKGGSRRIRPERLIVTSQYTIEEIWKDPQTIAALRRRFVVVEKIAGQEIII